MQREITQTKNNYSRNKKSLLIKKGFCEVLGFT